MTVIAEQWAALCLVPPKSNPPLTNNLPTRHIRPARSAHARREISGDTLGFALARTGGGYPALGHSPTKADAQLLLPDHVDIGRSKDVAGGCA